jgi:photosystem II stability/assembly factor-like uncharacterized protein
MVQLQSKRLLLCGAGWLAAWMIQPASAGPNTLTRASPYGGDVATVAFHPTNPSIVYATARPGFYRSTDGGQAWQLVNDSIVNVVRDLAVHPSQPNRVFAVTLGLGIYASSDAGATLSVLDSSTGIHATGTDVEYSADGSMLYVSTGSEVYRSADQGTTWQRGGAIPLGSYAATNLIVDPTDANHLYMVGDPGQGFQSADAGATWQSWSVPGSMIADLAVANTQTSPRIWAATLAGIMFSDNGGASWTNAVSVNARTLSIDPIDPTVVYAGTYNGLLRTQDNGTHWSNIQSDAYTGNINSIAIDPANRNHVLVGGAAGIASSSDGGSHWVSSHSGIDALNAYELVASPASDRIYINAEDDGIYALSPADGTAGPVNNRGLQQVTGRLGVQGRGLVVLSGAQDRLFVAIGANVARSLDGGDNWSLHGAGIGQALFGVVSASADGSRFVAPAGNRLYVTSDGGSTWTQSPATTTDVRIMASAPSNPQTMYAVDRLSGATRDVILSSQDGGNTWTTHNFPGTQVWAIAVDPANDQTLYTAGSSAELFKTTDGGQTWTTLTVPAEYTQGGNLLFALAVDPQNSNIVYVAGSSLVARSVDGGATWQELFDHAAQSLDVRSLAVDPQRPHSLYIGSPGRGVREFSVQPDLRITGTVTDPPARLKNTASYAYHISNAGPFDATNVRARIQLPAGTVDIVATSAAAPCTVAGTIVTCTAPVFRTNASADITVTATHSTAGVFNVVGTVEGDQPDAAGTDNSVSSEITIGEVTDVSATLTASAFVTRGEKVNVSLRVHNAGPTDAAFVSVKLELGVGLNIADVKLGGGASSSTPGGFGTCLIGANTLSCRLPQLPSGDSFTFDVVTAATAAAGSFSHTVFVESSGLDLGLRNNSAGAATTVRDPSTDNVTLERRGGGGGGSTSPFMIAALLLLSCLRAAANKFPRAARRPLF